MGRVLALSLLTALTGATIAYAHEPGLRVLGPEKIALTYDGSETKPKTVWIANGAETSVVPRIAASVEDADGAEVTMKVVVDGSETARDVAAILPGQTRRYRVALRNLPRRETKDVSGQLVVAGAGGPDSVELTADSKSGADRGVTGTLLWPLLPAMLLMAAVALRLKLGGTDMDQALPSDIDFKSSFATTVTGAGALLATVVSANVLPEDTVSLSKEGFVALNLIFGVAVVVAGVVYAALQRAVWIDTDDGQKQQRRMQGEVGGFLAASVITVWAVLGELLTVWLLLDELGADQGFDSTSLLVFKALILLVAVTMLIYVWRRLPAVVNSEREKSDAGQRRRWLRTAAQPDAMVTAPVAGARRSISLL